MSDLKILLNKATAAPWRRRNILVERLSEPLHLNLLAILVSAFGSFERKVDFDLINRRQYAFPILHAAKAAKQAGAPGLTVIEFGVASGDGLLNMIAISRRTSRIVGLPIDVFGFDTGTGMPPPTDYRDHPEYYTTGDYPMIDRAGLLAKLKPSGHLLLGDLSETLPMFSAQQRYPLGFVALDVDYYSSAKKALRIFENEPEKYCPNVLVYLDDITFDGHNEWCGELLALNEFNAEHAMRKIGPFALLRSKRLFKNARYIDQLYCCHVLDHPARTAGPRSIAVHPNYYL